MIKLGRNNKCNCGSGKKYKVCCIVNNIQIICNRCNFTSSNYNCKVCEDIDIFYNLSTKSVDLSVEENKLSLKYGKNIRKFYKSLFNIYEVGKVADRVISANNEDSVRKTFYIKCIKCDKIFKRKKGNNILLGNLCNDCRK